jgi:16S rRNA (guanine527-N7)-methyltransferase
MTIKQKPADEVWAAFEREAKPTSRQLEQFQQFITYMLECNQLFNLTAITDLPGVVRNHLLDSLALARFMDPQSITMMADIGTGAGFPAIPLKIMYPQLKIVLIEVTRKKQEFLANVITMLGLEDVEIYGLDWRTFLRTTEYPIDCFVTRAALDDLELIRMFRPACRYNNATLVYWASKHWEPHPKVKPFITRIEPYRLGSKDRRLVFMSLQPAAK